MGCIRFQINGNILRCRDGQVADKGFSILQLQGLFLNVIAEGAVSKDVVVVLAVDRLTIDYDIEILYTFVNLHTVLFVQHAHRAFGGGALLEQGIGACGQSRGGKAEHHACCQRSGSCPPGQNISFHRGSSFAKIITGGGYALRYFDYLTLYRILEANLRESP